jgi:hypothetical protein
MYNSTNLNRIWDNAFGIAAQLQHPVPPAMPLPRRKLARNRHPPQKSP